MRRLYPIARRGCGMRTLDYSPLFRSTVGFDRLFDLIDSGTRPDWPPYNIEKRGENEYRISMAIAGFGPEEIELVQEGNTLTVSGEKRRWPGQPPRDAPPGLGVPQFSADLQPCCSCQGRVGFTRKWVAFSAVDSGNPRTVKAAADQTRSGSRNDRQSGQSAPVGE